MFKILLALLLMTPSAWSAQWRAGTGENTLLGSSQAALIGTNSFSSIVQPLDSLLSTYCNEYISYASSSTITVNKGSCVVSNSQGTIRLFLQDTANSTLTSSNLDTGSLTSSTTYYIYSTAATNSATASTYYLSASNIAPSGQTYYYQIGSIATDSSTNFSGPTITNTFYPKQSMLGTWSSKSVNVIYQAATDGFALAVVDTGNSNGHYAYLYSDSSSSPSTLRSEVGSDSSFSGPNGIIGTLFSPVRKGDYYEFTTSGASINAGPYFLSSGT